MKTFRSLLLYLLVFLASPTAHAARQSRDEVINLLTTGKWHFSGKNFSYDALFDRKGSVFVGGSNEKGGLKWKLSGNAISIIFSDHEDRLYLPLDPKGTKGIDMHGDMMTATQIIDATTAAAGTPKTVFTELQPRTQQLPGGQTLNDVTLLLTSGKWRFTGGNWAETRIFDRKGTMIVPGSTLPGVVKWEITPTEVVITFVDHQEKLALPLDPRGTRGVDAFGKPFTAMQQFNGDNPMPITLPTPAAIGNQQTVDIITMLTEGSWRFAGAKWSNNRTFRRNGIVDVENNDEKSIRWQIVGNEIVIVFKDHQDRLLLPLDPKGTKGLDAFGIQFTATKVADLAPGQEKPAATLPGSSYYGTTEAPSATPTPASTP